MTEYFLRLFVVLPLVGGLAWGSLWLWKRFQLGLPAQRAVEKPARLVDVLTLGTAGKLAVVDFDGRLLLVAASRQGISLVAESGGNFADV